MQGEYLLIVVYQVNYLVLLLFCQWNIIQIKWKWKQCYLFIKIILFVSDLTPNTSRRSSGEKISFSFSSIHHFHRIYFDLILYSLCWHKLKINNCFPFLVHHYAALLGSTSALNTSASSKVCLIKIL